MSEKTVEVKMPQKFYENVCDTMKRNAWMGFESVEDFMFDAVRQRVEGLSEEDNVRVNIKVPRHIMEMLEKEKYFGWDKEAFFTAGVHHCIGAELCEMTVDETDRLERLYGEDLNLITVVRLEEIEKKG